MHFHFEDRRAIAAGRYLRAADFPVIDPAITLASYDGLIRLALDKMPFLSPAEEEAVCAMLRRVLDYMMSLPASSTHHHRTAGGLFYHSFETATLAAESVGMDRSGHKATEALSLTAFVAGLLHDFGKVVATFRVHPLTADIQDIGFGQMEEPVLDLESWDPHAGTLWAWCREHGVSHLALHYQRNPDIGHEAALKNGFWQRCVPGEVIAAIGWRAPEYCTMLEKYMEGGRYADPIHKIVRVADKASMTRDLSPLYRSSPKRSDLHIVRRCIEFSALSPWNNIHAPFLMGDIWCGRQDMKLRLPLFRARRDFLQTFREYLLEQDTYGAAFRENAEVTMLAETLERHGVLIRSLPGTATVPAQSQHLPAFSAAPHFPGQAEDDIGYEALSYFPQGIRMSWLNMPPVRVLL